MKHFTPTLPAGETSKNVRSFIKDNQDSFWNILKPLLPFLIGFELLDVFINHLLFPGKGKIMPLGALISSYFMAALMISWHRVVIHGADRYVPMNPFKPKRNELAFIFVPLGLIVLYMLVASLTFFLSLKIGNAGLAFILVMILVIFATIAGLKIAFYLPAKAIDADITLSKSWRMTTGYVWKIFAASFFSWWRVMLVAFAYIMASIVVGGIVGAVMFGNSSLGFNLFLTICMLPVVGFFSPLIGVITVTVLSNYYQWAINNPRTVP
ncbi:MAG: hypothetical protein KA155_00670 [Alphaproteobacteria bacterium]|jgi:hypothetical protein|nr:hypothetical protein [Alphaproteobacteria bacterium]